MVILVLNTAFKIYKPNRAFQNKNGRKNVKHLLHYSRRPITGISF